MAYGLWLYKELKTEYGYCKVEIERKDYTGGAIEIGAFAANSLTLSLDNLSTITSPIGKSVCSFAIIDTEQVSYDDFFTPDATKFKVVVYSKIGESGSYYPRWSGFITPDFFAENLSYRSPISVSARDNIGYLNDVDFDIEDRYISVRNLINRAFNRISTEYPMTISFVSEKQTTGGILAIDSVISTTLLQGESWYFALENILHDLGLQMRWVDNNTIAVMDLSQIPEYYTEQEFNFIGSSGYREITPALREFQQEQDYGVRENFFDGWVKSDNLTFRTTEYIKPPVILTQATPINYYTPNNWTASGSAYTINIDGYSYVEGVGRPNGFGEKIYFTGVGKDATDIGSNYISYTQDVYESSNAMKISFKAFNSVQYPNPTYNNWLSTYKVEKSFTATGFTTGDTLQLGLRLNILLHTANGSYILGQSWESYISPETDSLRFILNKIGNIHVGEWILPSEEDISINIGTIPTDGQLELRIYGFTIEDKTNVQEDAGNVVYDWLRCVSYINEVKYAYVEDNLISGQNSNILVSESHNVLQKETYIFGEIPTLVGSINAYAGGLINPIDYNPLTLFRRNTTAAESYNLLELVGRELIHFNNTNYNKLSGQIKNFSKDVLGFNHCFTRDGSKYIPYAYSLNVISNEMNITAMQEVVNYTTGSYTEINSEVTTGGATVGGGGNNTILQYSASAGNAKRVYELDFATEEEREGSYVLIDKEGLNEAVKIPISELGGLNEEALANYLTNNQYATLSDIAASVTNYLPLSGGMVSGVLGGTGKIRVNTSNSVNSFGYLKATAYGDSLNRAVMDIGSNYGGSSDISSDVRDVTAMSIYRGVVGLGRAYTYAELYANQESGISLAVSGDVTSNEGQHTLSAKLDKATFDSIFGIDENGNIYIKKDGNGNARVFYNFGDIVAGGYSEGGSIGGGGLVQTVYGYDSLGGTFNNTNLTDTFNAYTINAINERFNNYATLSALSSTLENYVTTTALSSSLALYQPLISESNKLAYSLISGTPTSLPASDVYAWAKASVKPAYTTTEVAEGTNLYFTNARAVSALSGTLANYVTNSALSSSLSGYLPLSGNATSATKLQTARTIWGQSFDGSGSVDGSLYANGTIASSSRLRVNASGSTANFGFLKAETYSTNRGVLHIGSNYGATTNIDATNADVVSISMYRGSVGIGRQFTGAELYSNYSNGTRLYIDGNTIGTGEITAGSDIRYKFIENYVELKTEDIASAPIFNFRWMDRADSNVYLGTSAQYWKGIAPFSVSHDKEKDFYSLNYGAIGVAIGVSNAKKILSNEERLTLCENMIEQLRNENKQLRNELNQLRYGIE